VIYISKEKCFVVITGREPGFYKKEKDARKQTVNFPNSKIKVFDTMQEAKKTLGLESGECEKSFLEQKQTRRLSQGEIPNIYVDGSFDADTGICAFSFVVVKDNKIEHTESDLIKYEDFSKTVDQNIAEIKAVELALKYLKKRKEKEVVIYYDSRAIENVFVNNAKTKKKEQYIVGKDVLELAREAEITVFLTKVKAHNGNEFNDYADFLAKNKMRLKRDGLSFLEERLKFSPEKSSSLRTALEGIVFKVLDANWSKFMGPPMTESEFDETIRQLLFRTGYELDLDITKEEAKTFLKANYKKITERIFKNRNERNLYKNGYHFLKRLAATDKERKDIKSRIASNSYDAYEKVRMIHGFDIEREKFEKAYASELKQRVEDVYKLTKTQAVQILIFNERFFWRKYQEEERLRNKRIGEFLREIRKIEKTKGFTLKVDRSRGKFQLTTDAGVPLDFPFFEDVSTAVEYLNEHNNGQKNKVPSV